MIRIEKLRFQQFLKRVLGNYCLSVFTAFAVKLALDMSIKIQ